VPPRQASARSSGHGGSTPAVGHDFSQISVHPAAAASGAAVGLLQRKTSSSITQPTFIERRPGNTDVIEDAYGGGSLDDKRWRRLLDEARRAVDKGDQNAAQRAYLALYADVATLAQASRVLPSSSSINVVSGTKAACRDAKPGLNFTLKTASEWGDANGTTAYVDEHGTFGVAGATGGAPQPLVALVLTRTAFKPNKEETLAILRHEMIHAEHDADGSIALTDPKAKPAAVSTANTELLAYVEGFMTMFHLADPVPTSDRDPAFFELLGALSTRKVFTWASADPAVRSEALGRLQQYYCKVLERPRQEAFDNWVAYKLGEARRVPDPTSPSPSLVPGQLDFFTSLNQMLAGQCRGLRPSMTLPRR
jgi:hypothetical protein